MKQKILLLFTLFFIVSVSKAQDREFWFVTNYLGYNATLNNRGGFFFSNANEKDATVTIYYYKTNITQTITIPAKSGYAHTLTGTFISTNITATFDGIVRNCGVHITSTEKVSVYFHWNQAGYEYIISLKGKAALGTEFYVTQVNDRWSTADASYAYDCINIVAPQDGTIINFTPTRNCYGSGGNFMAGTTYTRTLNKGQTFSFRELDRYSGPIGTFSSLAGTHVTSNKPIAVTSTEGVNADPAADQLIPVTRLGTDYVIVKGFGATANSERTYITATENNTKVYATPESGAETLLATLDAGKTTVYIMGNKNAAPYVLTIRADKPVSVMQYVDVNQLQVASHTDGAAVPDLTNLSAGNYSFYNIFSASDVYNAILTIYKKGSREDFTIAYNGNTYPITASNAGTIVRYGDVPGYPNLEYMQWELPAASRGMLVNVNNLTSAYTLGYYSASILTFYTTFAYFSTFTGGDERDICSGEYIDPLTGFLPLLTSTETYQWQSSLDSGVWTNITGATSDSYSAPNNKRGTTYYRITKVDNGIITASGQPIKVRIRSCQLPVNHNISAMGYYD